MYKYKKYESGRGTTHVRGDISVTLYACAVRRVTELRNKTWLNDLYYAANTRCHPSIKNERRKHRA